MEKGRKGGGREKGMEIGGEEGGGKERDPHPRTPSLATTLVLAPSILGVLPQLRPEPTLLLLRRRCSPTEERRLRIRP
jgi:hypothetical protein